MHPEDFLQPLVKLVPCPGGKAAKGVSRNGASSCRSDQRSFKRRGEILSDLALTQILVVAGIDNDHFVLLVHDVFTMPRPLSILIVQHYLHVVVLGFLHL